MLDQIVKYRSKLMAAKAVDPGQIAFAVQDDELLTHGEPSLAALAATVISRLSAVALVAAAPSVPFADLLVRRASAEESYILPRDTETRTFLHDIPFIRRDDPVEQADLAARLLGSRKGIIVEGVGIVAGGMVTVEQAFINYSSIFHATFVKYLEDLLSTGFLLPGERETVEPLLREALQPVSAEGLVFDPDLSERENILAEMARVGRYTVERGLVDSFFGNISCRDGDTILISQTGASLDELEGSIDPVPMDNSSTAGITASSELLAHRTIYENCDARVILHAHPKLSVVMSMLCTESDCTVRDCWRDCPRVRLLGDAPVVSGEIGAGGLAKKVAPAIAGPGKAVVYGHGVFTTGNDFGEAFAALVEVENRCRSEFLNRIGITPSSRN